MLVKSFEKSEQPGMKAFELSDGETLDLQHTEFRYWGDSFPTPGDGMYVPSVTGACVDPLHLYNAMQPGERSEEGRWELYMLGFLEAGNRLVDGLKADEMADGPGAALLYPILLCYRHYLELALKDVIFFIVKWWPHVFPDFDRNVLLRSEEKARSEHGLRNLWETLKQLHPTCDAWASNQDRTAFGALLSEIHHHDVASQSARYPIDAKGKPTLTGLSVVDLGHLKQRYGGMAQYVRTTRDHLGKELNNCLNLNFRDDNSEE